MVARIIPLPPSDLAGAASMLIQCSETGDAWRALPRWVRWFLSFGYAWGSSNGRRRICVISTPCDSPAAGLIALGMMRRRLEVPEAGDLALHLGRLRQLFKTAPGETVLRHVNRPRRFYFAPLSSDGSLRAFEPRSKEYHTIIEEFAYDWYVDGQPPMKITRGAAITEHPVLRDLFDGTSPVLPENLSRTDSAVCIAGHVAGALRVQKSLSAFTFLSQGERASLSTLLTVHGWYDGLVSRVGFYNSRTRELDRSACLPMMVCADGAVATSRVHSDRSFSESDLIGVVPRTSDVDQLEDLAQQLGSLAQWYSPDGSGMQLLSAPPHGVSVLVLRKD